MRNLLLSLLPLVAAAPALAQDPDLRVSTDVFELGFSVEGGVPSSWRMTDVPGTGGAEPRYDDLLDPEYLARSNFRPFSVVLQAGGEDPISTTDNRTYSLSQSQQGGATQVVATSPVDENGLQVTKTWTLQPSNHLFELQVEIANTGSSPATVTPGLTLGPGLGYGPGKRPTLFEERFLPPSVLPFVGAGNEVRTIDPPLEEPYAIRTAEPSLTFAGLQTDFTVLAVIPSDPQGLAGTSIALPPPSAATEQVPLEDLLLFPNMTVFHDQASVAAGSSVTYRYSVYAGPKKRDLLAETNLGLENIPLNYLWGWFASACFAVEWVVVALKSVLGGWGISLVVLAILFRLVVLPLSLWGARAQVVMKDKMAAVKPLIEEAKTKHKNAEKRNDAILAIYKEHGINPFGQFKGCLPLFIQLPILIALVQVLLNSYDLIDARFLWIEDLTRTDRFISWGMQLPWLGSYLNLLPLVMFAAMVVVAKIMQSSGSSKGGSMATLLGMPIVFTIIFYPFPAGCMLFWTTGTVLQIAEQKYIAARLAQA